MKKIKFWRKTVGIEAIQLTAENMREIAIAVSGDYFEELDAFDRGNKTLKPHIEYYGNVAFAGDWYAVYGGLHRFWSQEEFSREFQTHPEQMADDERYAHVFQLVRAAMSKQDAATYHGESSEGMDLVAIQTTKKILGHL